MIKINFDQSLKNCAHYDTLENVLLSMQIDRNEAHNQLTERVLGRDAALI